VAVSVLQGVLGGGALGTAILVRLGRHCQVVEASGASQARRDKGPPMDLVEVVVGEGGQDWTGWLLGRGVGYTHWGVEMEGMGVESGLGGGGAEGPQGQLIEHTHCGDEMEGAGVGSGREGVEDGWQCDSPSRKLG